MVRSVPCVATMDLGRGWVAPASRRSPLCHGVSSLVGAACFGRPSARSPSAPSEPWEGLAGSPPRSRCAHSWSCRSPLPQMPRQVLELATAEPPEERPFRDHGRSMGRGYRRSGFAGPAGAPASPGLVRSAHASVQKRAQPPGSPSGLPKHIQTSPRGQASICVPLSPRSLEALTASRRAAACFCHKPKLSFR